MKSLHLFFQNVIALGVLAGAAGAAPIPGLFNTGVANNGTLLANGAVDPHWRMIQSADVATPGPNAIVITDTLYPIVAGPWLASGPSSKWIGPMANQSAPGSAAGDYKYRLTFDLNGLDSSTAVLTLRISSDNLTTDVLINGVSTGFSYDGNFAALSAPLIINSGFVNGTNTLDCVVNNASAVANPTAFRAEISGTAELFAPPGTPPSIVTQPVSQSVSYGAGAFFLVQGYGSLPLSYQWLHNGVVIPGATGLNLTFACATPSEAGSYAVAVNNAFGAITSTIVSLTVTGSPPNLSPAQFTYELPGPSSRRTGLAFTEIMYHPTNRADGRVLEFVEIYNSNPFFEDLSGWRLTGDITYTFPSNTLIQGNSYRVIAPVPADMAAVYGLGGVLGGFTNRLSNEGGTLRLRKRSGGIVLEVNFSDQPPWPVAADGAGHSLVLARPTFGESDSRAWAASGAKGGSPGAADPVPTGALENVVINEILAQTEPPALDYIELYNHSAFPVDLSGCWLSDDPETNKFRIGNGTTLAGRGFIAFNQTALGFGLSAAGETIYLVNSNNTRVLDTLRFDGQANGVAYGRSPDGAPTFHELAAPTFGTTNAPLLLRSVVINEIMYHPLSENGDDEYVELHNRGVTSTNIGGWRFTAGIDFTFPAGWTIPAGGYCVVAKNASRLMTNYPGLNSANLLGNYSGNLADGGDRVTIGMPDIIVSTNAGVPSTNRFYIPMDEVRYTDGGRWGRWSDGGGASLELIDARSDNRLPSNWADSLAPTNAGWMLVSATGTLDNTSIAADRLQIMLMGEGEALVDDIEVIYLGINRVANTNFDAGITGWTFGGTHSKSGAELADGYNSARSLHLRASDRGDLAANRVFTPLTASIPANSPNVILRARAKWLRGHPEILLRLKGNGLDAVGRLPVPTNPGTPGARNTVAAPNTGPAITEVAHRPVLPAAFEAINVTARVRDPDGVQSVRLKYRLDPSATVMTLPMTDDGLGCDATAGDGIFTAAIPGQSADKLIAFRVEATDGFPSAATTQFPADAPARECLVRTGETQPAGGFGVYRFWQTKANRDTWTTREKLSNEDLDGTFVSGTNRVIYNAGAHYSGSSYTSPIYTAPDGALCGYDIAFPNDDAFLGETHMVMDWPVRDDTDQREQLQFWLLDQYGLPNMYRRYVIMFFNGVRRGPVMDDIQQPSGATVAEWFSDDSEGTLLKTDCWDEFNDGGDRETSCLDLNALELYTTTGGAKKTPRYRWTWRPRATHGTANDFSDLFALVDAANAPTNTFISAMECLADMEHWMRTFAMNDLSSFWDAFGNPNAKNTYLYKPERDTWKLMCWDFDVGLGVFNDPVTDPLFPLLNDTQMNRIQAIPQWRRLYWCALSEGVNSFFNTGNAGQLDAILDAKFAAFQASGIALNGPAAIKSWISQRRTFLLGQLAGVNANFAVTGSTNVTTNGNFIAISGTAPVSVHTIAFNGVAYAPTWTTVNNWTVLVPVAAGSNNLSVAALDRAGRTNATRTVVVNSTGTPESPMGNVVINEIMYNPVIPEASFLELFNRSTNTAFDLSGWRINGLDFTFPEGTVLTNRGFLVITKNRAAYGAAYGWGTPVACEFDGQLDDGGETLSLIKPGATPAEDVVVDIVTYDDDPPWPVTADGQGASLQLIDPAQDNNRVSNWSDGSGWKFFSYTAAVGGAGPTRLSCFFEAAGGDIFIDDVSLVPGNFPGAGVNVLANPGFEGTLTPPWNLGPLAANTVITNVPVNSGNASLHLVIAPGATALTTFYQDFPALTPNTNYTLSFWYFNGERGTNLTMRLNSLFVARLEPGSGRAPTPAAPNSKPGTLAPFPPLWLSEIQPINTNVLADNFGDFDPWIEIHNSGADPISLHGFALASGYANLGEWPFPPGLTIGGGQYLLVWADAEPGETAGTNLHASFRLNPTNGTVVLSRDVGAREILDYINYRDVGTNRSFGSYPPGQLSHRQTFYRPTPGRTNDPTVPPVTLFINEWMAANVGAVSDPADGQLDDWFEIYNPATNRVDLAGFTLTDTSFEPAKFRVPAGISVPPRGFLLVWADNETTQTRADGDLHVNFRLDQNGEMIGLYDPAGQAIDVITFNPQTNNISQGRWPDGAAAFYFMNSPTPRATNVITILTLRPDILSIAYAPGNVVTLIWAAQSGSQYRVEFKNALDDAMWMSLPGDVPATGATAMKNDTVSGSQRFYRVRLVQ